MSLPPSVSNWLGPLSGGAPDLASGNLARTALLKSQLVSETLWFGISFSEAPSSPFTHPLKGTHPGPSPKAQGTSPASFNHLGLGVHLLDPQGPAPVNPHTHTYSSHFHTHTGTCTRAHTLFFLRLAFLCQCSSRPVLVMALLSLALRPGPLLTWSCPPLPSLRRQA